MANRERTRSRSTSDSSSASPSQEEAFQVGETTLDLEDISEEDLETLYFEDNAEEESSFLNLQTMSGLSLILAGVIYLLSEIGVWADPTLLGLGAALPWLAGALVILAGFGVLSWRSSNDKDSGKRKKKAVDAETGEPKIVEEPKKAEKNRLERSRTNKKLMGVCGGLAEYLNLDATLVRIAFVIGTIATSGPPFIIAYFGLAFAMPKEEPLSPEEKLSIIRDEQDE